MARRVRKRVVRKPAKRRSAAPPPSAEVPERTEEPVVELQPEEDEPVEGGDRVGEVPPAISTVVGVGASAGGLEAFSQLLESLPDRVTFSFIFVQHLSPQHESALPALLGTKTRLPVVQVVDGMRIEPGHVYVIPPNVQMGISDSILHLTTRTAGMQFAPVDYFFQSLAAWAQSHAVGVILSGTASDGAAGIREIKAAGGITIAQQPTTAKYDGMPRSAIATGLVDLVLSPHEIANHLAHLQDHPYIAAAKLPDPQLALSLTQNQLGEIFSLLRRVSGVDFRNYKTPTVQRRLLRRMALRRLTSLDDYLQYLRGNPQELRALYQDLLIHVTRFFRDPDSFEALAARVLPELLQERSDDEPLRIWVPGCATGEEAYSIAILLLETLGDQASSRRIQVFATDVSETAIEVARAGVYSPAIIGDVSSDRLRRFFSKADGGFKINKVVRDLCVFARHDLTRDPPFSRLDLIVCRNVMIYLDAALQRRLVSLFHYALKRRGFLVLGTAETTGHQSLFVTVDKKWRVYQKQDVERMAPAEFVAERFSGVPLAAPSVRPPQRSENRSLNDETNRILLQKYGPPGVVVDQNSQIIQFRGSTGLFLESASGEPNLNILKMAREGLLFPLRSALQAARRSRHPARRENVLVRRNGGWHPVDIEVIPLGGPGAGHFLVVFDDRPEARGRRREKKSAAAVSRTGRREMENQLASVTRELAASRDYMQSVIQELEAANEELQSANEEILSSNEELQSTNEELDTAKEELQSTNEELNTVNEELHSRNDELSRVNSDLINLFAAVDLTVLIIGDDMRIRRFTPMAERMFNLIPTDVGRPIGQINTNLVTENLEELVRETISTMMPREIETQDRQGRWYLLKVRPYKNVDNRIDGALVTVTDIGRERQLRDEGTQLRFEVSQAIETSHEPIVIVDHDARVKMANPAFGRLISSPDDQSVGHPLFELLPVHWDRASLRSLVERVQTTGERVDSAPISSTGPEDGRVLVSVRRVLSDLGAGALLTLHVAQPSVETAPSLPAANARTTASGRGDKDAKR